MSPSSSQSKNIFLNVWMVYKFCIGRVSCFEFMCAVALSCQANTVWIQTSASSGSCHLSIPSFVMITELWV